MITSIRHKGLKKFFNSGGNDTRGINSDHADKLRDQLAALDSAEEIADMDLPGWRMHPLNGCIQASLSSNSTPAPVLDIGA